MVIFLLAMAAVVAALWARSCFAYGRRVAGEPRRLWFRNGAFSAAAACGLVGLALLARIPALGLAALAGGVGFAVWGVRLALARGAGAGSGGADGDGAA